LRYGIDGKCEIDENFVEGIYSQEGKGREGKGREGKGREGKNIFWENFLSTDFTDLYRLVFYSVKYA
jgi:hypothetical protein